MKSSFEAAFPNITRWVKGFGTVEIGYDPQTGSFIRAIDKGGMAWSGESHYKSLDNAFEHLENGIKATTGTRMRSAKRKVISKPSRTTRNQIDARVVCQKTLSPGKFRSLIRSSRLSAAKRTFR